MELSSTRRGQCRANGPSPVRGIAVAIVALCALATGAPEALGALPAPKTGNRGKPLRLLFVVAKEGWRPKAEIDAKYRECLQRKGFAVTVILGNRMLTGDYLKQFNCVVVVGMDSTRLIGYHAPNLFDMVSGANNEKAYRAHVASGGGLLFHTRCSDIGPQCAASFSEILAPYGISVRAECVRRPGANKENLPPGGEGSYSYAYSWTDQFAPSPVTAGLKRLYYPTAVTRWDDAYATNPLIPTEKAWVPLVRGGAGSRTFVKTGTYVPSWWKPGTISEPPVLLAARDYGKGRIAVCGINPFYTVLYCSSTRNNNAGECNTGTIDFITLSKGDGTNRSDGLALFDNLYCWLAEPGLRVGHGQGQAPPPAPPALAKDAIRGIDLEAKAIDWDRVKLPRTWATGVVSTRWGFYPEVDDPLVGPTMRYHKVLVGARSRYSTGEDTVQEMAAAAKAAGYSILAFTERFADVSPADWQGLRADCAAVTTDDFICLAGIDIEDEQGQRFVVFGQQRYPFEFWLDRYRRLLRNQATFLQFGNHMVAAHRCGTSPFDYRLLKHFCGVAIATWGRPVRDYNKVRVPTTDWKRLDDGWPSYQWHAANESNPVPLVVKEVRSVADIARAAKVGMDPILPAETLSAAVRYLRHSLGAWWDNPGRFFVSGGPVITCWAIRNKDEGAHPSLKRWRLGIGVRGDVDLDEVVLLDGYNVTRRWRPKAKEFRITLDGHHGMQHHFVLRVRDRRGRQAISPTIRTVSMPGWFMRCGDRQNFFNTPVTYTGFRAPLFRLAMPVAGQVEGRALQGGGHGTEICPVGEYRLASNALNVTEATIDQRYAWATRAEVSYDARPLYAVARSQVLDGKLRYLHLMGTPWILCEATIRPRHPFVPTGRLWPAIGPGGPAALVTDPKTARTTEVAIKAPTIVPKGTWLGGIITLTDGLLTDGRAIGFDAGTSGRAVSTNAQWTGRFLVRKGGNTAFFKRVPISKDEATKVRQAMGLAGKTPYTISTTQGRLDTVEVLARFSAADGGVAGAITPADIGYELPLHVAGVNPNCDFGLWRPGKGVAHFGIFEGAGWARINIARGATFYAGNLVLTDQPALKASIGHWDRDRIEVQVHNPTGVPVKTRLRTPAAITDRCRLDKTVTVPAGSSLRITAPQHAAASNTPFDVGTRSR